MNYINSIEAESKQIENKIGSITDIVHFIPDFFEKNMIHKKVLEILENNSELISSDLWKINFTELFEITGLLESHLLSQDIETYKEYLKYNWWLTVNIDYWNKCSFTCSHCSINWNKNWSIITINDIEEYFNNFSTFDNIVKKIQFNNWWEIFERENFDKVFRYFLEKWVNDFEMISRWINEIDQNKSQEKKKLIIKKVKKLKKDFPDFNLTLWISLDNFSKLNFWKIIYNTIFLYNLNIIFNNKHLYFSCTHDFENKEETNKLINWAIHYLDNYIKLWKFNFLFQIISSKILDKINKVIDLWEFEYESGNDERNHFYRNKKKWILLQFDYTSISDNWRWTKQNENSLEKIDEKEKIEILKIKNKKQPNFWEFGCMPLTDPKTISIQTWWNIKACNATHLKYQKEYNYGNIKWMNENEFISYLSKWQTSLYKKLSIDKIIKLIQSKRKGNFICMNNMMETKEKEEK